MNRFLGIAGRRDGVATERETRKMMEGHELLLAEAGQKEADLRAELDRRMQVWQIPENHVKFETRLATVRARFCLDTGRCAILSTLHLAMCTLGGRRSLLEERLLSHAD